MGPARIDKTRHSVVSSWNFRADQRKRYDHDYEIAVAQMRFGKPSDKFACGRNPSQLNNMRSCSKREKMRSNIQKGRRARGRWWRGDREKGLHVQVISCSR